MPEPSDDALGADNPYIAPSPIEEAPAPPSPSAEEVRREHLGQERRIRTLALLTTIVGIACTCWGWAVYHAEQGRLPYPGMPHRGVVILRMGVAGICIGIWLRRPGPYVHFCAILYFLHAATIAALYFLFAVFHVVQARLLGKTQQFEEWGGWFIWPIGLGLAFIFWLIFDTLLNRKAWMVFSAEYREIAARTPHLKP